MSVGPLGRFHKDWKHSWKTADVPLSGRADFPALNISASGSNSASG